VRGVKMGKIQERLVRLLEAQGFNDIELRAAQGSWRTDVRLDVYRWEGTGRVEKRSDLPAGLSVMFASWDTMTSCVRRGIELDKGDSGLANDFLVWAASQLLTPPADLNI